MDFGVTRVDPEISAWVFVFQCGSFDNDVNLRNKVLILEFQCGFDNSESLGIQV